MALARERASQLLEDVVARRDVHHPVHPGRCAPELVDVVGRMAPVARDRDLRALCRGCLHDAVRLALRRLALVARPLPAGFGRPGNGCSWRAAGRYHRFGAGLQRSLGASRLLGEAAQSARCHVRNPAGHREGGRGSMPRASREVHLPDQRRVDELPDRELNGQYHSRSGSGCGERGSRV